MLVINPTTLSVVRIDSFLSFFILEKLLNRIYGKALTAGMSFNSGGELFQFPTSAARLSFLIQESSRRNQYLSKSFLHLLPTNQMPPNPINHHGLTPGNPHIATRAKEIGGQNALVRLGRLFNNAVLLKVADIGCRHFISLLLCIQGSISRLLLLASSNRGSSLSLLSVQPKGYQPVAEPRCRLELGLSFSSPRFTKHILRLFQALPIAPAGALKFFMAFDHGANKLRLVPLVVFAVFMQAFRTPSLVLQAANRDAQIFSRFLLNHIGNYIGR